MVSSKKKRRFERQLGDLSDEQLAELSLQADGEDTPSSGELHSLQFAQLEEELQVRRRELTRLVQLEQNTPKDAQEGVHRQVAKALAAVREQADQMSTYLDEHPELQEMIETKRQLFAGLPFEPTEHHPQATEWRQDLVTMLDGQSTDLDKRLSQEQETRIARWRQQELDRLDEQYRQIEQSFSRRQQQLERTWSEQLQSIELAKLQEMMNQERAMQLRALRDELDTQKQAVHERSNAALEQLRAESQDLVTKLQEQQQRELRLLEIEWREQEILERERPRLQQMWTQMVAELTARAEAGSLQLKQELFETQRAESSEWLREQALGWANRQDNWLAGLRAEQQERDQLRWEEEHRRLDEKMDQVLKTYRSELQSDQQLTKQALSQLTSEWRALSADALQAARVTWQRGQEQQIALLEREWTKQLTTETRQAQLDWQRAKQDWSNKMAADWSELQQQALPELRRLTQAWLDQQAEGASASKQQFDQQATAQLLQQSQQFERRLAQYDHEINQAETRLADLLSNQEGLSSDLQQELRTACALQLAENRQQAQTLQATQLAIMEEALESAKRRQQEQAEQIEQVKRRLTESTMLLATEVRDQVGEQKNALAAAITSCRQGVAAWLDEQGSRIESMRGEQEQRLITSTIKLEAALADKLTAQTTEHTKITNELLARYCSELAKGHGDLLRQSGEQVTKVRQQAETLLQQELRMMFAASEQNNAQKLNETINSLEQQQAEACQTVVTQFGERLEQLANAANEKLQQKMQQAQFLAEQAAREHWLCIYNEMLERQKAELSQAVTTADQRLLEELRQQVAAEVQTYMSKLQTEQAAARGSRRQR